MTDFLRLHELQVQREVDSATAGYGRFLRNQQDQSSLNRGSNSAFGVYVKGDLIPKVIENMTAKLEDINRIRESEIKRIMRLCIGAARTKGGDIKTHDYWDLELVAFLGLQLTLDTAMNPNYTQHETST